ncbi:hypothetical protein BBJ41_31935 [Burkholderia stabilis]|nr:hypothetical protein BBJ41_31935 [Burkholderia stabilis]
MVASRRGTAVSPRRDAFLRHFGLRLRRRSAASHLHSFTSASSAIDPPARRFPAHPFGQATSLRTRLQQPVRPASGIRYRTD